MKALCQPTGAPVTFEGRYYHMRAARNLPPPAAAIPILIGGAGDRVLGIVARHADAWDIADEYLDRVAERSSKLDQLLAQTGRTLQRTIQIPMSVVAPTAEQLRQNRPSLGWGAFGDVDAMMARIVELTSQAHFDEISLVPMGGRASFDRALEMIARLKGRFAEQPV